MSLDRKQVLGIVLAHGARRNEIEQFESVWLQTCDRLIYFTPIDDCLSLPGRVEYSVGRSANYSPHTNQRCREALRFAAMTQYNWVQLIEWDSMIFGMPERVAQRPLADVYAPVFHDPQNPKFEGKFYLHFPQVYRRIALERVVAAMDKLSLAAEGGFTDRYVGLSVERAGLNVCDMNLTSEPTVYTKNHIDDNRLPEALASYRLGARWSHGIKERKIFTTLRQIVLDSDAKV